ncbi:MAG: hypothetical protein QNJ70_25890 [Xenococcaceae cyanobacterium MO_207.B15]|nr:hypothetical protein [Xenococcaceae cyanobacterium MO_207.B15]
MKSTLQEVILYQNNAVLNRFTEKWDLPFDEARDIFKETKKWLWLIAYNQEIKDSIVTLFIIQSPLIIDEMWHTFILFTKDYHKFCDKYFGYYIHHYPRTKSYH